MTGDILLGFAAVAGGLIGSFVDFRVRLARAGERLAAQQRQIDEQKARLDHHSGTDDAIQSDLAEIKATLGRIDERLKRLEKNGR